MNLRISEFWNLTPREASVLLDDHIEKQEMKEKKELANIMVMAWNVANFSNAKKLPDLKKIIKGIMENEKETHVKTKNKMSSEEMEQHYHKKVVK